MSTEIKTLLRVEVSQKIYESLEKQAKAVNTTVEVIAQQKLLKFGELDSVKPIIIDDKARQFIEKLLARNFSTCDELTSYLQRMVAIDLGDAQITLSPFLLERLKSRCIGMEFGPFLQQTIKRALEEFAGMR